MSSEIELKLEVAADAAERLIANESLLNASGCRSEHQLSVYYDTLDFRLRKNGYALRVRSIDKRHVQTLKALDGGAGLFNRGEWECDIDGPNPDLARLAGTPVAELQIEQVEPVIRSKVDRTTCRVDQAGSELEFDLDRGIMTAAKGEIPVSELELELISGQPRAAIELAQRIGSEIPVKLSVMSKAERGFALADGKLSKPSKAQPVFLDRGMSVAEGFETIVAACLRHFRLNEPLVVDFRNIEGLHQARVAMRRLRSALALFRQAVCDQECGQLEDELNWFTAELGDARNLDVYLERSLTQDQRLFLEAQRENAYDLAIAAMESARFRRLMLDLVGWAAAGQWRGKSCTTKPLKPFMDRRIDRLWSKISDSDDVTDLDDDQRHHLRIRMKKLRYALEFAAALHNGKLHRRKKFMKTVKGLQESIGNLHDIVIARSLVTLNSWLTAPGSSAKRERRLVRDADRALHRLSKLGPYWA